MSPGLRPSFGVQMTLPAVRTNGLKAMWKWKWKKELGNERPTADYSSLASLSSGTAKTSIPPHTGCLFTCA